VTYSTIIKSNLELHRLHRPPSAPKLLPTCLSYPLPQAPHGRAAPWPAAIAWIGFSSGVAAAAEAPRLPQRISLTCRLVRRVAGRRPTSPLPQAPHGRAAQWPAAIARIGPSSGVATAAEVPRLPRHTSSPGCPRPAGWFTVSARDSEERC
jgi:hypothetical protein